VSLGPVNHETFSIDSNLPYALAVVSYRLPGTDSPDYAAARVLADVLASQRGNIYGLVPAGKALEAQFELAETYPKASAGFAYAAVPAAAATEPVTTDLTHIVADYLKSGLPAELVDAAKRSEIAGAAFRKNSIPDLAAAWSQALSAEGRNSPDDSGRTEFDRRRSRAKALGRTRVVEGIWRRRTADVRADQAGDAAVLGRIGPVDPRSSEPDDVDGRDDAEQVAAHRQDRSHQSNRDRGGQCSP
jgi:hypothetical protein